MTSDPIDPQAFNRNAQSGGFMDAWDTPPIASAHEPDIRKVTVDGAVYELEFMEGSLVTFRRMDRPPTQQEMELFVQKLISKEVQIADHLYDLVFPGRRRSLKNSSKSECIMLHTRERQTPCLDQPWDTPETLFPQITGDPVAEGRIEDGEWTVSVSPLGVTPRVNVSMTSMNAVIGGVAKLLKVRIAA